MKAFLYFLILLLFLFTGCAKKYHLNRELPIPSAVWEYSRNDKQATASIESDFKGKLNLIWEDKISEISSGPLSIIAGNLVVCGSKGKSRFYDLATGKYMGRFKTTRPIQSGMLATDSLVYYGIAPDRNEFVCINLHNQKMVWSLNLKDVSGLPIIIDNYVYIASATGQIYCLDRFSGETAWQDSVGAKSPAGPSGTDNMVIFPFEDGRVKGYNAATGDVMFTSDLGQPAMSKAVVGDKIYQSGIEGTLFAIEPGSGKILWQANLPNPIWTSPALDNGRLYLGDNGGILHCLSESDGSKIWEFKTDGVIVSSPIVVGDYVLFASLDRFFYCLDKQGGSLISRREFKKGIRFPAVSDGHRIYVVSDDGLIQCFGD